MMPASSTAIMAPCGGRGWLLVIGYCCWLLDTRSQSMSQSVNESMNHHHHYHLPLPLPSPLVPPT